MEQFVVELNNRRDLAIAVDWGQKDDIAVKTRIKINKDRIIEILSVNYLEKASKISNNDKKEILGGYKKELNE